MVKGLIIGFIIGYLIRLLIAICLDEYQTNKEFRKAKIEVDLDKCCKNAYNYGYEVGKREEKEKWETENRHILVDNEILKSNNDYLCRMLADRCEKCPLKKEAERGE